MKTLKKLANVRNVIILLVLFLFANFFVIPAVYPKFETLDILTSYSPDQVYNFFSSYGEKGRNYYLVIELTLDIIYPFITALLFSLATLFTFQRAFPNQEWLHKLALLPFGIMVADYLENASIVTMLLQFPQELPALARISNFFTSIKFALSPLELLLVVVGLIGWLVQVIRSKQTNKANARH